MIKTLLSAALIWVAGVSFSCAPYLLAKPARMPEGGREYHNLTYWYGRGADQYRNRLNVFQPAGAGPHPVIVFAHGGGWRAGDLNGPFGVYRRLGKRLAAHGFVAVIPGYRLAPDYPHPAQVRDVSRAIAWTFEHAASYGGDPNEVFIMGHSAGAQLVALAAVEPRWLREAGVEVSRVAGVIAISGPYDVANLELDAPRMVRDTFGAKTETWAAASPASHLAKLSGAVPPFLVAVADGDPEMLLRQGHSFSDALRAAGVSVADSTVQDRSHNTIIVELADDGDALMATVESFVAEHRAKSATAAGTGR